MSQSFRRAEVRFEFLAHFSLDDSWKVVIMIHLSVTCVSPVSVTEDMECRQRDLIVRLQELPELFPVTESPGHEARHQDTEPDHQSLEIFIITF